MNSKKTEGFDSALDFLKQYDNMFQDAGKLKIKGLSNEEVMKELPKINPNYKVFIKTKK